MSERPFMQLYVSDFIGDTLQLSAEQIGAYMLLLMAMWNAKGKLPADDAKLARVARVTLKKWREISPDLMAFFERDEVSVWSNRLLKELQKSESKSQSRASAGSRGGKAKALKNNEAPLANATRELKHSPDTITREEDSDGFANAQPSGAGRSEESSLIPEPATQKKKGGGGLGSAEERFWQLAGPARERGIARSLFGQLANALNGDFERGVGIVSDALAAKSPRPYLARIIRNVAAERAPPSADGVPEWAKEARAMGYPVNREGKFWRMSGALYDDEGEQIGN